MEEVATIMEHLFLLVVIETTAILWEILVIPRAQAQVTHMALPRAQVTQKAIITHFTTVV